mgnify:CR=1 FL=1
MFIQPRILTYNFHEPYLCLMAKSKWHFDVGNYSNEPMARHWHSSFRPIPDNIHLVEERIWRARLAANYYDVIITQNESNALDVASSSAAKILICHNRRTYMNTSITSREGDPKASYDALLNHLQQRGFQFVFISDSKKEDYGIDGKVIYPGVDPDDFGAYNGETPTIIRVGNVMRQRDLMFDVDFQEACCKGLQNQVVGMNPLIPESQPTKSFEELQSIYRNNRCMLHVSREAYEDGYNLSTLEAMATGMPVVTLSNPTSPITDGVDGYSSYDAGELNQRLAALLEDQELAKKIGAAGRETIFQKFPMDRFVQRWEEVITLAAEQSTRSTPSNTGAPLNTRSGGSQFLVHYVASPLTTGRYIETALRHTHTVTTAGFRVPEEVLKLWGFPIPIPSYAPHDVEIPLEASYAAMKASLPEDCTPDFYLFVDSGPREIQADINVLSCPKVAYLIDTHVSPDLRLDMARNFDVVFLAQKAQVDLYRRHGIQHCYWLPLGCSPELHNTGSLERIYDVSYVGSFSIEEDDWRKKRIESVMAKYPKHKVGRYWPEDMAKIYAQSKVVVNAAFRNDVNMRVFEAMASGALLITDEVEGLTDLFTEGEHLVIYRSDDELFSLLAQYLADDEARERIAQAGQKEVLTHHSYDKRMASMLDTLSDAANDLVKPEVPWEIKENSYYEHPRRELFPFVPAQTRRLLDVGCGTGTLAALLKKERGLVEAAGIEIVEAAYHVAKTRLDKVLFGSIEDMDLPYEDGHFDCILCADVLEHLVEPELALKKLARVLAPDGVIVISIPNIQFHEAATMLMSGAWTYMDQGIMDTTHLRFFTRKELGRMLERADLQVGRLHPLSASNAYDCPREPNGDFNLGKLHIQGLSDEEHENFLCYQWLAIGVKPKVDRLARARTALDQKQNELAYTLANEALKVDEAERFGIMAKAMARLGQLDDADKCYQTALEYNCSPDIAGDYGTLLVGMQRMDEAKVHLEAALKDNPNLARAKGALGLVHIHIGDKEEAHKLMLAALQSNYDSIALLTPFLQNARTLDQRDAAIPVLENHCNFFPGNADLVVALAELYNECGQSSDAIEKLEQAQIFHPEHKAVQSLLNTLKEG